ncbi:hypothetical protein [Nocardiopsis sp. CC223A]|uniref:hypothetical protein n=1 Tax=Nocardiopsis sp. CC223A TaxID=3044051 RepID=UPI00278C412F|nr:hypothetical protein [Nocardiopsis sp. CC223A]
MTTVVPGRRQLLLPARRPRGEDGAHDEGTEHLPDRPLGLSLGPAIGMGFAAVPTGLMLGVTLAYALPFPLARRTATAAE